MFPLSTLCHVEDTTSQKPATCKRATRTWPYWHPDLGLPVSRTKRNKFLLFISHPVYDTLLQEPVLRYSYCSHYREYPFYTLSLPAKNNSCSLRLFYCCSLHEGISNTPFGRDIICVPIAPFIPTVALITFYPAL